MRSRVRNANEGVTRADDAWQRRVHEARLAGAGEPNRREADRPDRRHRGGGRTRPLTWLYPAGHHLLVGDVGAPLRAQIVPATLWPGWEVALRRPLSPLTCPDGTCRGTIDVLCRHGSAGQARDAARGCRPVRARRGGRHACPPPQAAPTDAYTEEPMANQATRDDRACHQKQPRVPTALSRLRARARATGRQASAPSLGAVSAKTG